MHLELMTKFKTSPRPIMKPMQPLNSAFGRPTLPMPTIKRLKSHLPREAVILTYEPLGAFLHRLTYYYNQKTFSVQLKDSKRAKQSIELTQIELDNVMEAWKCKQLI